LGDEASQTTIQASGENSTDQSAKLGDEASQTTIQASGENSTDQSGEFSGSIAEAPKVCSSPVLSTTFFISFAFN